MMTRPDIDSFLSANRFAVAGASNNREKYGNKVFLRLVAEGFGVVPIHPSEETVEGHDAYPTVEDVPETPESLSIVTPPPATRAVVESAIKAGVQHIWMQPGAEDEQAAQAARDAGMTVIDDGSCILVALATRGR